MRDTRRLFNTFAAQPLGEEGGSGGNLNESIKCPKSRGNLTLPLY